jgi:hypothetical protein
VEVLGKGFSWTSKTTKGFLRPSVKLTTVGRWGEVEDLMNGKRGQDNEPRKVGMYLAKELCNLKLTEITAQFGTGSYGTVGWAVTESPQGCKRTQNFVNV